MDDPFASYCAVANRLCVLGCDACMLFDVLFQIREYRAVRRYCGY